MATHHLFWAKIDIFCQRRPIFQCIRCTDRVTHARSLDVVFASVFCPKQFSRFHNELICSVNFRQLMWKIRTFLPKFCEKRPIILHFGSKNGILVPFSTDNTNAKWTFPGPLLVIFRARPPSRHSQGPLLVTWFRAIFWRFLSGKWLLLLCWCGIDFVSCWWYVVCGFHFPEKIVSNFLMQVTSPDWVSGCYCVCVERVYMVFVGYRRHNSQIWVYIFSKNVEVIKRCGLFRGWKFIEIFKFPYISEISKICSREPLKINIIKLCILDSA